MTEKAPAFQFYPKDWLSDARVRAMGREARGVYIDLLAIYWNEGGLPSDPKALARIAVVPERTFDRLWPLIAPCFGMVGTSLTSKRLDKEKVKQAEYKASQALKGQKSAKSRSSNKDVQPRLASGSSPVEPRLEPKSNSPFASSSSSASTEQTDPGRVVKAGTTATPDGTPVKLSDLDGSTETAPRRLTPQALGIKTDPANFAQVQLAHDLTALATVVCRPAFDPPLDPKVEALALLHDISTTPAGKRIETLDLRRVPSPWCSVSSHAARKLALEVYGVELDSSVPREDDPASVALGEAIRAKFATPAETGPAQKAPTLSVTVAPGRCPMCDGPLTHSTEGGEKVFRCTDEQALGCDWAVVW